MKTKSEADTGSYLFSNLDLKKLIIPLAIEQTLAITVGMVDIMMVSFAGEAAISGVSLVDMINNLLNAVFAALATGGAVVTAQFIGAKRKDMACRSAKQLNVVAVMIAAVIMAACLALHRQVLGLLFGDIEDAVMESAVTYFLISTLSYPFLAVYNSNAALFRSMGNSKISMKVSVLVNLINVLGNAFCIFVLHMGVAGVAIPTLISRMAGAVVMFLLLRHPDNLIYLRKEDSYRPDLGMIRKILYIGIPNGLESGIFQLGRVVVVSIIATFGTVQIAANSVANSIDGMGTIVGQSFGLAMITVVGQCVGAGSEKQVRYYTKKLLKLAYLFTAVVNSLILVALPLILKLYALSPETTELAWILIMIHNGTAILLWPLSFTLPNALRSCNDVRFAMVTAVFSMIAFRVLFSYILGAWLGLGAIGVWIAMIMDWIFRVILFAWRWRSGKWKAKAHLA